MHDNCNPSDCPVSARVDALEREFDRYRGNSSDTHRQMFDRIGALEQSGATPNQSSACEAWASTLPLSYIPSPKQFFFIFLRQSLTV